MNLLWQKYADNFNQRILRERVIIALCSLALIYGVWELAINSRQINTTKSLLQRIDTAQSQLERLTTEERVFTQALINNPNAIKQKELIALEQKLAKLDKQITELSVGLVEAKELPVIIRSMLSQRDQLSLLGMHVMPPQRLAFDNVKVVDEDAEDEEGDESQSASDIGVFKHSVVFRLKGHYFELIDYLTALENSNWQFYWRSLDYQVDTWPEAVIQLEAYTLSTQRGFISE